MSPVNCYTCGQSCRHRRLPSVVATGQEDYVFLSQRTPTEYPIAEKIPAFCRLVLMPFGCEFSQTGACGSTNHNSTQGVLIAQGVSISPSACHLAGGYYNLTGRLDAIYLLVCLPSHRLAPTLAPCDVVLLNEPETKPNM